MVTNTLVKTEESVVKSVSPASHARASWLLKLLSLMAIGLNLSLLSVSVTLAI